MPVCPNGSNLLSSVNISHPIVYLYSLYSEYGQDANDVSNRVIGNLVGHDNYHLLDQHGCIDISLAIHRIFCNYNTDFSNAESAFKAFIEKIVIKLQLAAKRFVQINYPNQSTFARQYTNPTIANNNYLSAAAAIVKWKTTHSVSIAAGKYNERLKNIKNLYQQYCDTIGIDMQCEEKQSSSLAISKSTNPSKQISNEQATFTAICQYYQPLPDSVIELVVVQCLSSLYYQSGIDSDQAWSECDEESKRVLLNVVIVGLIMERLNSLGNPIIDSNDVKIKNLLITYITNVLANNACFIDDIKKAEAIANQFKESNQSLELSVFVSTVYQSQQSDERMPIINIEALKKSDYFQDQISGRLGHLLLGQFLFQVIENRQADANRIDDDEQKYGMDDVKIPDNQQLLPSHSELEPITEFAKQYPSKLKHVAFGLKDIENIKLCLGHIQSIYNYIKQNNNATIEEILKSTMPFMSNSELQAICEIYNLPDPIVVVDEKMFPTMALLQHAYNSKIKLSIKNDHKKGHPAGAYYPLLSHSTMMHATYVGGRYYYNLDWYKHDISYEGGLIIGSAIDNKHLDMEGSFLLDLFLVSDKEIRGQDNTRQFKLLIDENKPISKELVQQHLVYHLTKNQTLPAQSTILQTNVLEIEDAITYLLGNKPTHGKYVQIQDYTLSFEMLVNYSRDCYKSELLLTQYVYGKGKLCTLTVRPADIFNQFIFNAKGGDIAYGSEDKMGFSNALMIAAFHYIDDHYDLNITVAFDQYKDKMVIAFPYNKQLKGIKIVPLENKTLLDSDDKIKRTTQGINSDHHGANIVNERLNCNSLEAAFCDHTTLRWSLNTQQPQSPTSEFAKRYVTLRYLETYFTKK